MLKLLQKELITIFRKKELLKNVIIHVILAIIYPILFSIYIKINNFSIKNYQSIYILYSIGFLSALITGLSCSINTAFSLVRFEEISLKPLFWQKIELSDFLWSKFILSFIITVSVAISIFLGVNYSLQNLINIPFRIIFFGSISIFVISLSIHSLIFGKSLEVDMKKFHKKSINFSFIIYSILIIIGASFFVLYSMLYIYVQSYSNISSSILFSYKDLEVTIPNLFSGATLIYITLIWILISTKFMNKKYHKLLNIDL